MKIDPKYFNTFLVIVAVIAAILIAVFTLKNRSNEKQAFQNRIVQVQDSLSTVYWRKVQESDSLQIADFKNKFVILDFWANWSASTKKSHQQLSRLKSEFPDTLEIIAAEVGLTKKETEDYIKKNNFPFHFVAGAKQFKDFRVPGLPAEIIFTPKGDISATFLGFSKSRYDSLRAIIRDGGQ